jgi:cobaltochelatase CobT
VTHRVSRAAIPGGLGAHRLRAATSAVYYALAGIPGRRLAADPSGEDPAGWQLLLTEVPRQRHPIELARWRGRLDAIALRARYSDASQLATPEPLARAPQTLFWLLEQIRVEVLGARKFPGAAVNLAALVNERWVRARPEGVVRSGSAAWVETIALLARVPLGAPLPPSAQGMRHWRSWFTATQAREIEVLSDFIEDQQAYAQQALRVIEAVLDQVLPLSEGARGSERCPGIIDGPRVQQAPVGDAARWDDEAAMAPSPESVSTAAQPRAGGGMQGQSAHGAPPSRYAVFTTAFDQVASASELADAASLQRHRRQLDQSVGQLGARVMRCARQLQRHLLAMQMRSWDFDRDQGVLDAARLTRVITHRFEPLAYQQEAELRFPDTVVTLLLDNSGSMRGLPIANAAICAELLGRALERCAVKTEILGFTTRSWGGGRARAQWLAAGRPDHPGRISELLHVVYKSADEPWRRARSCLGLMLDEGLLKENIDGEALLWAHQRLLRRPERRRILLVISDGAPRDDATLEANDAGYLERHLHTVIDGIEARAEVELAAIGIGHDVTQYYRRAITLPGVDVLGEAMVAQLVSLFEAAAPPGSRTAQHAATRRRPSRRAAG